MVGDRKIRFAEAALIASVVPILANVIRFVFRIALVLILLLLGHEVWGTNGTVSANRFEDTSSDVTALRSAGNLNLLL